MIETERLADPTVHGRRLPRICSRVLERPSERALPSAERLPSRIDELRAWIERGMPWGVWERETGELVGDCSLFFDEGHCAMGAGVRLPPRSLGPRLRDRGGAGVRPARLRRARARQDRRRRRPGELASVRVLENCGFTRVAELEDASCSTRSRAELRRVATRRAPVVRRHDRQARSRCVPTSRRRELRERVRIARRTRSWRMASAVLAPSRHGRLERPATWSPCQGRPVLFGRP